MIDGPSPAIRDRRQEVARLYCEGMEAASIARRLRVSGSTIGADVAAIRRTWNPACARKFPDRR